MTLEYKKLLKYYVLGLGWFYLLLWPFMGLTPEGIEFLPSLRVLGVVALGAAFCMLVHILNQTGKLTPVTGPVGAAGAAVGKAYNATPKPLLLAGAAFLLCFMPALGDRYVMDVAINVLIYICLGLGLNIVVGLAGLLDLGYIAFYGVGAYSYALLSVHYGLNFFFALPIAGIMASIAGMIIGYPTLRMRGDYLAIVTLGFGEIVRLILNNWMSLTNGPNGIMGIKAPGIWLPSWASEAGGITLEFLWLKKLNYVYFVILGLTVFTIVAVYRLNHSRVGRAWEAIREDETAAELMGVNTFYYKLIAYGSGAVFGGLAGAFFAARMRFVSPNSFTFIESAMVLSMVVLGGMGSIPGVIVGALALIALPEVFREFETYRMLAFGAAMTIMMLFKPQGLIPAPRFGKRSEED